MLAWLLCRERLVFRGVADHRDSTGLGGYRKEGGERNNKYKQQMQSLCMKSLNDMPMCYIAYINDLVILGIYFDLFY